jgi:iron complex transport system ATP-binding protein
LLNSQTSRRPWRKATLLDRVNWVIDEADRWVIIGPNGAGKTTLLQLVSRQHAPDRGRAAILDEVLGAVDVFELRPRIGVTSAALADRIPARSRSATSSCRPATPSSGRWREEYDG